ncbi:high mobility group box domain containing protein [Nitzschia inconspicua]|uniref:High mobility group box domain containing protein n=1 Tax=Nitzschia inconspicua TaxID=303405 RepID=A0A9K3L7U5_9STRA|nr:high mobility group box domain containing protein [Nitzschia inconspicua]
MESKSKKSDASCAYRKAPQAPRRFKSPYILFSMSKMQEYKSCYKNVKVTSFSSQISKEWKELTPTEKQKWKEKAEQDKYRYNVEKSQYTGPWVVPSESVRKKRPKDAPKRPPSAFLNYCQKRRTELKKQHPGVKNTDISKMLGDEWNNAPVEIRQPHINKEAQEREEYYKKVEAWKEHRSGNWAVRGKMEPSPAIMIPNQMNFSNLSVMVPPSPPTPDTSTAMPVHLLPRNGLPLPTTSTPNTIDPSVFQKPSIVESQASSNSIWECDSSMRHHGSEESLIPTILPPVDPPNPHSDSVFSDVHVSLHQAEDNGKLGPNFPSVSCTDRSDDLVESEITRPTSLASQWLSDAQSFYFPNIFQGDTSFDPPIY